MPAKYKRLGPFVANREDLAWAAGFADGEGSFYTLRQGWRNGKPRQTLRPRFEIGQAEPLILEKFREIVGFGAKVNGPYGNTKEDAKREAKPQWVYYVSGFEDVQALLAMLWIWLGPTKRKQAIDTLKRSGKAWDFEIDSKRVGEAS